MKYKHFRALVIVGALGVGVFGVRSCCRGFERSAPSAPAVEAPVSTPPAVDSPAAPQGMRPSGSSAAAPTNPSALRPIDQKILARVKAGVTADKIKDVFPGDRIKVNLYNEGGQVRAKVDLDRDDRWDEKWDFETAGGTEVVKRRVSTADDDTTYDLEFRLVEGRWAKK